MLCCRLSLAGVLLFATESFGTNLESGVQIDGLPVARFASALDDPTVTYFVKIADFSNYMGLGQYGYFFPQFGRNSSKTKKTTRDNMVFRKPSWQKDWEWKVFEKCKTTCCGKELCNLFSPDAGIFDYSEGEKGIGVYSKSNGDKWASFRLPTGQTGNSGSVVDEATNDNSNNTVNHIRTRPSAPSEFCMSIVTDNTSGSHNPNDILQARIGDYDDDKFDSTAEVPAGGLTFNNIPDFYMFKFSNMSDDHFIKIRLKSNTDGGFGGLMFDPCPCEGDFTYDGDVDDSDLSVFDNEYGRTNCSQQNPCRSDFDHDGDVDDSDLSVFNGNYGRMDCHTFLGVATLKNVARDECLEGFAYNPYQTICSLDDNQKWEYRLGILKNIGYDQCLDGNVGLSESPSLETCSASDNYQKWQRIDKLWKNVGSGLCLDGYGITAYMYTCDSSNTYQQWTFQSDGDFDDDGVANSIDNCTEVENSNQRDTNGDGCGNVCDPDIDNDNDVDAFDLQFFAMRFGQSGDFDEDLNGDGKVDAFDLQNFVALFGRAPGPSPNDCSVAP